MITLSWDAVFGASVAVLTAIATATAAAFQVGLKRGKALGRQDKARELNDSNERKRYLRLYVPLQRLFDNHFLTTSTSELYPRLSQRIRRAYRFLANGRIHMSVKALVDSGFSEAAEFECGSDFPIEQIQSLISANLDIADQEIQHLTGIVRRQQFDEFNAPSISRDYPWEHSVLLSDQELSLLRHIHSEYDKLNSRFTSPA